MLVQYDESPSRDMIRKALFVSKLGGNYANVMDILNIDQHVFCRWMNSSKEFFQSVNPSKETILGWIEERKNQHSKRNAQIRLKRKLNPALRVENAMRARIWAAIKGRTDGKLFSRLSFTRQELMTHLEALFLDGMTWDNYGKWHVDHIKPCALFDHSDKEQFNECWSLKNLQPLWASDNIKKGAKYECA